MDPARVEALSELKSLLNLYETAIERHKKLMHDHAVGKERYSEIGVDKFQALAKGDLKILIKDKQKLIKEIEETSDDTKK